MSRGLVKGLKEVFREIKFFGDAEIATLKRELEAHKAQLQAMKAARAERAAHEERLALAEMRKAVEHLQAMEGLLQSQDKAQEAATDELARKAGARLERDMTARAMSVLQGVDLGGLVTADDEGALGQQLERLQADLEAVARGRAPPAGAAGAAAAGGAGGAAAAGGAVGGAAASGGKGGRRRR